MSFPAYPEYKDSGVAWLGEVPSHWEVVPLWTLYRRTKRTGFPDEELLSVYRDFGVLVTSSRDDNFNKASEDLGVYQVVNCGDLVINKMKAWQGSVGVSAFRGIVSPAYFVFEPLHSMSSRYLHYLFRSEVYFSVYMAMSKGIRINQWDLDPQSHSRLSVLLPPIVEQTAIAAFLDYETAKIDALIAEQEKLIELLKEKRLAVISHAVTKGLDPNAPMKDSGVEWLGQVPGHWDVAQIKQLIRLATSGPRGWADLIADEGALFFQSQNIGYVMDVVIENSQSIIPPQNSEAMRARLLADDVVMCITGGRTGAVAHLAQDIGEAYINQHVCLLRPNSSVCGRYLAYCLFSFGSQQQLMAAMYGLKQGLGLGQVQAVAVASPHFEEQIKIVDFLDHELTMLDGLLTESQKAITLLKERRSALISAAVTGKIDVRGYAPQQEAV